MVHRIKLYRIVFIWSIFILYKLFCLAGKFLLFPHFHPSIKNIFKILQVLGRGQNCYHWFKLLRFKQTLWKTRLFLNKCKCVGRPNSTHIFTQYLKNTTLHTIKLFQRTVIAARYWTIPKILLSSKQSLCINSHRCK